MTDGMPSPDGRGRSITYIASRYVAASLLLLYGFAKINGSQFTVLDSELDKPLGDVSGFWLTWYYFGYSRVYGTIVALVQVAGALALFTRRYALAGACVLVPVMVNIILIDIFYGVEPGALTVAVLIACCLARILYEHRSRLQALVLPAGEGRTTGRKVLALSVQAATVIGAFVFTYYVAHYNNRHPTPIDGTWLVLGSGAEGHRGPTHVYFERNRARLCVFRYSGRTAAHHFEVNPARRTVRVWDQWMRKGPLLFEGTYDAAGRVVVLDGQLPGSPRPVRLTLRKQSPPRGPAG